MRELNTQDLDNYITGHWGEDRFEDDTEEETTVYGLGSSILEKDKWEPMPIKIKRRMK
jgi:hypothetical protein